MIRKNIYGTLLTLLAGSLLTTPISVLFPVIFLFSILAG